MTDFDIDKEIWKAVEPPEDEEGHVHDFKLASSMVNGELVSYGKCACGEKEL